MTNKGMYLYSNYTFSKCYFNESRITCIDYKIEIKIVQTTETKV